jgi:predicted AAA+ superfamily ATPase
MISCGANQQQQHQQQQQHKAHARLSTRHSSSSNEAQLKLLRSADNWELQRLVGASSSLQTLLAQTAQFKQDNRQLQISSTA